MSHTGTMKIQGIDHFNICTPDLERLIEFYTGVLGFEVGDRPPFDSPGAWLYANGHPLLHVGIADESPEGGTSPFDHIAFAVTGLGDTVHRLEARSIEYKLLDVPARAMKQIFVTDPDGIRLELNFAHPDDVS